MVPAARGTITDRNGVQLAISESADKIVADDLLIKQPLPAAQKLAPLLGQPVLTVLAKLTKPHDGYVDPGPPAARRPGHADHEAPDQRHLDDPGGHPGLPARLDGLAGAGRRAARRAGRPSGLECRYNQQLAGINGVRRIVNDAIGQPISIDDVRTMRPGKTLKLTIDAALQDEVEQVLAGVGAAVLAQGRHGDRHEPEHRRDPGPGQLAPGQRQRSRRARRRGPQPIAPWAASTTSRARRSRRSRWRARSRTASSAPTPSSTSRRCCRSPIARSTTPRPTATRR